MLATYPGDRIAAASRSAHRRAEVNLLPRGRRVVLVEPAYLLPGLLEAGEQEARYNLALLYLAGRAPVHPHPLAMLSARQLPTGAHGTDDAGVGVLTQGVRESRQRLGSQFDVVIAEHEHIPPCCAGGGVPAGGHAAIHHKINDPRLSRDTCGPRVHPIESNDEFPRPAVERRWEGGSEASDVWSSMEPVNRNADGDHRRRGRASISSEGIAC
jgi:hypothetical protein